MATTATPGVKETAIAAKPVAEDANVFWIFQDELLAINKRRQALGRPEIPIAPNFESADKVIDGFWGMPPGFVCPAGVSARLRFASASCRL